MMLVVKRVVMVLLTGSLCFGAAFRRAEAAFDTQVLESTRGILGIPEQWVRGEARAIVLNGARIRIATGRSEESLHALLNRAEANCRARSAGLHGRAKRVAAHVKRVLPAGADGVMRVENEREGLVACLNLGLTEASFEEIASRISEFAERGDLQALGGALVLRAEARERGAFFVTAWSEGSTPLREMFPPTGDAPGTDFTDLPRPAGARRVLSAWQENGAPAIGVYESVEPEDVVWERYTRELTSKGFVESVFDHAQSAPKHALMMVKGAQQVVIASETLNSKTRVAVMPLSAGRLAAVVSGRSDR